jgi:hypothetical protein
MYQQCKDSFGNVSTTCIKRIADNAFVPTDPANTDYQAFLKYQADGGRVYGADEEVPNGQTS